MHIRHLEQSDYPFIISVVNEWWGGRNMADMLPKLFFVHFRQTSFVAERDGKIVGFLVGFVSQTFHNEAYIHFAGVHPEFRKKGLGCALYEQFFEVVKGLGCSVVRCITSPVNKESVSFHLRMSFSMEPSEKIAEGIPVSESYDGRGEDRVLFYKKLGA
ncbi:MAG: GNAT family N-acetyltransferase [Pseudomonadota bacterium]